MTINPYMYFNGNAADAIAFYEKVFGVKAVVAKYKDAPAYDASYAVQKGTENYVMHANMDIGGSVIMFCDTPEKSSAGDLVQLMVSFDSIEQLKKSFEELKGGGTVTFEPQKTFWSDCFGSVKDKFGVDWLLSYENEAQRKQSYGE